MNTQPLVIRVASTDEVDCAAEILGTAIARAGARGFESWPMGHFGAERPGRLVLQDAAQRGELHLAWLENSAVATFTLQSRDAECWPHASPEALYLHRLGVSRPGAGIGRCIVRWCEQTVRARGRACLRLDCLAANPQIRSYYEALGFQWHGDVDVDGRRLSLYELRCATGPG